MRCSRQRPRNLQASTMASGRTLRIGEPRCRLATERFPDRIEHDESHPLHEFGPPEVMKLENVHDPGPLRASRGARSCRRREFVETYIRRHYALKPLSLYARSDAAASSRRSANRCRISRSAIASTPPARSAAPMRSSRLQRRAGLSAAGFCHLFPRRGSARAVCHGLRALFSSRTCARRSGGVVHGASGAVGIAAVQFAATAGLTVSAPAAQTADGSWCGNKVRRMCSTTRRRIISINS